jgi:hypothetical protein
LFNVTVGVVYVLSIARFGITDPVKSAVCTPALPFSVIVPLVPLDVIYPELRVMFPAIDRLVVPRLTTPAVSVSAPPSVRLPLLVTVPLELTTSVPRLGVLAILTPLPFIVSVLYVGFVNVPLMLTEPLALIVLLAALVTDPVAVKVPQTIAPEVVSAPATLKGLPPAAIEPFNDTLRLPLVTWLLAPINVKA